LNLSFPDHVHCPLPVECSVRRSEKNKPQSRCRPLLYEPVVLFDNVV
jgi:hypothetical protein